MLQLYIANKNYSSWSLRPWILMSELQIPFEEKLYQFLPGSNYTAFKTFSPSGKVPCLVDEDVSVWDSLAITEYVAESNPNVWPQDRRARAWARSAAAEMHSGFGTLRTQCGMNCGIRVKLHEVNSALQGDLDRLSELWNDGLRRFGGPFLAGQAFTAVDAFFCPVAFRIQTYGLSLDDASLQYAARLRELRSMRAWYEAALAETFRDEFHDEETRKYGVWLEDTRAYRE
jgi:glutathione S-transferase